MYVNPQPSFEELEKYYPSTYPPYLKEYRIFSQPKFLSVAKRIYRNKRKTEPSVVESARKEKDYSYKKVLDFGCGKGDFILSLKTMHPNWEFHGFDIATNKEVKSLSSGVTIHLGNFSEIEKNFPAKSFDTIYLNNVLEHMHDPHGTLERLSLLIKKGGDILIEVPNINSLKFKIFRSNFSSLDLPRHLYHFSPTTLRKLCEICSLHVTSLTLTGTTKSTVQSINYLFHRKTRELNPILFRVFSYLTRLIGKKRIDTEVIVMRAVKI
jgi:2-polyprenyl-3-methyl-5-hydroxy-6-metoxy-1,4-benzoquinol methylase